MNSVFRKEDFSLCDVPVPQGYHQSQTHAGAFLFNDQFYLTTSPYPNPKRPVWKTYCIALLKKISFGLINLFYRGEDFENPLIYKGIKSSNDDIPVRFRLFDENPLMEKPNDLYGFGSYNSDPDLFIEDGKFYIINREFIRHPDSKKAINSIYLIQGRLYEDRFIKERCDKIFDYDIGKSPCMAKYRGNYWLFSLDTNSYNDGTPCKALIKRKSLNPLNNWDVGECVNIEKGNYEPWHMSIFENNGILYAIIACIEKGIKKRCWQMLGEFSEDLMNLKIYQKPLTVFSSYRGAAIVTTTGEFVLYSTTVYEHIKGSKSVDGRDVIMAHMPFEKVLSLIHRDE